MWYVAGFLGLCVSITAFVAFNLAGELENQKNKYSVFDDDAK